MRFLTGRLCVCLSVPPTPFQVSGSLSYLLIFSLPSAWLWAEVTEECEWWTRLGYSGLLIACCRSSSYWWLDSKVSPQTSYDPLPRSPIGSNVFPGHRVNVGLCQGCIQLIIDASFSASVKPLTASSPNRMIIGSRVGRIYGPTRRPVVGC